MIRHSIKLLTVLLIMAMGVVSVVQADDVSDLPMSDEHVIFKSGNPHTWSIRDTAMRGGKARVTDDTSRMHFDLKKPSSAGGLVVNRNDRFDLRPYLSDPAMRGMVRCQFIGEQVPKTVSLLLISQTKLYAKTKRSVKIQSEKLAMTSEMRDSSAWYNLYFTFDNPPQLDDQDELAMLYIIPDEPCEMLVDRISLQRFRNVSLQILNQPVDSLRRLVVSGQTAESRARVFVKIVDAQGKKHFKYVDSKDGRFELRWDQPPLSIQANNTIFAHIGKGDQPMDQSVKQDVFGYQTNTDHVWLSVEGRHLMTSELSENGKQPFIPSGVGYARNVVIPAQDEAVAAFCKSMGLNTIRLPFYLRYFNNREHEPIDLEHHLKTFVDPVIQAAKRHGLYVILDCHSYFTGQVDESRARKNQKNLKRWTAEGLAEWADRWGFVAAYYKNEPYVMGYELCNEPHDIQPEVVRAYYSKAREAIRKVDQRHILIVGTNDWSHARALEQTWGGFTQTFDSPYNNVVYAFHDYPTDNHPWLVQGHIVDFMNKYNVPVMCTEFGATWWDHDETVCREFQAGILGVFARQDVGWMVWALKRVQNNPRKPHPLPKKVTDQLPKDKRPRDFDSCAYSDIWGPIAKIMASPFPQAAK